MNQCKMLHETVVRDVVDVLNGIKNFDQVEWIRSKNHTGSIARRASNLILVFPVVISTSISIETASIISKAIERKCTALLQILFASINLTRADNLEDYISQFHSNLDRRLSLDDFIDTVDKLGESGDIEIVDRDAYEAVREDINNLNFYLNENFNPVSINEYVLKSDLYGNSSITLEANNGKGNNNNKGSYVVTNDKFDKAIKDLKDNINDRMDRVVSNRNAKTDNSFESRKDASYYFKYQLLPQDINKANELMPTLVMVNFTYYDNNGILHGQTGVVGVKAKLYPVDAMDIVSRLASKYKDSNSLFNFVRASTREISFFRDFAFAIDKAKLDAINVARESNNAKIFKLLERRAAKNRFSSLIKRNDASPITSLVISQDEVEYLKKYNSIDMDKSFITRSIMESYNLMDIVIVDESLEISKFLYDDGDGIYETISFDSLEKQASDNSYKKIINLMSKLNR